MQKEEAFRSPSSPEEGPPMTSLAEKGRGPNYKVRFRLKLLRYRSKTSLKRTTLFLLTARWRAAPFEDLVRPRGFSALGPLTWMFSPVLKLELPGHRRWPFSSPEERNYRFPPSERPLSKRSWFPCSPLRLLLEALPPTFG